MQSRLEIASELLKLPEFERRAKRSIRSLQEHFRWQSEQPQREAELQKLDRIKRAQANPHIRGAGSNLLVLNSQGRSVLATNDEQLAESFTENRFGRRLLDLADLDRSRRRILSNQLRGNAGGKLKSIVPAIPPRPEPSTSTPKDPDQELMELASEVRREVLKLSLEEPSQSRLLSAALHILVASGWDQAMDLIFERHLALYVQVLDQLTGHVETFETAEEASSYATWANAEPDGMLLDHKGRPSRFRFKIQKPGE